MTTPSKQDIASLKGSGLFDAERYRSTYPDVDILGMDPTEHYLKYGRLLGRMPADIEMVDISILDKLESLPAPKPGRALLEAHEICRAGDDALGLAYAKKHIPEEFAYTIQTLRANAALRRKDEGAWMRHLNAYLEKFKAAPIQLGEGATLFDRFTTAPLPAVTGGPLISVIMPAWNAEQTVRKAAQSILNQTWRNLELLIVDDCSADGTWARLQEIAALDRRVKILRNKVNVGPYVSKNIALMMAKGEWITGHDADDWAHPHRLEQHMLSLEKFSSRPRASISFMVRFETSGVMDRFAPISEYSLDGIARDAAIACTFERNFLIDSLGSWDCVRFGADSELISRSRLLIGDEFKRLPLISMLCMNYESSLTNDPVYGVSRTAGPSAVRLNYNKAWVDWHKNIGIHTGNLGHLCFPPKGKDRRFEASEQAMVPVHKVWRNFAAHTDLDPACDEAVTAICSSNRPWFAYRVAEMMKAQTHLNLHMIYVAHGSGHDMEQLQKFFEGLRSVKILELPDAEQPLGAALNLALDHCQTDICAKIDDDDFYGPNYIRSSLAAFHYSGHEGVGIVGRERAYVYAEDMDFTGLRYAANHENALRSRVFGGTIFWSRKSLSDQRFLLANNGEDSDFFRQAVAKGIKIFSAEAADYLHMRYQAPGSHTWVVKSSDFMKPATVLATGLRLDLAYSSQHSIGAAEIPSRNTDARKVQS